MNRSIYLQWCWGRCRASKYRPMSFRTELPRRTLPKQLWDFLHDVYWCYHFIKIKRVLSSYFRIKQSSYWQVISFRRYKVQFRCLYAHWSFFHWSTLISMDMLIKLWLFSICHNKDRYTVFCDAFLLSSFLKVLAVCVGVVFLLYLTWRSIR